jgi:uncharacterized protein (UPF0332 family)
VKDETGSLLAKAHQSLSNARTILGAGVAEVAAREAYMAAFHAAQAYLADKRDRVPKTHAGVHGAFGQLAASTTKSVSQETAETAIEKAVDFLAKVEVVLEVRLADDQQ